MLTKKEKKIISAIKMGGEIIRRDFGKNLRAYKKSMEADFFTKTDLEAEEKILGIIKKEFNGINVLAEESGLLNNCADYTFVLDPLDGTNNYVLGIPYFSVAGALMHGNETIFACVYNPILDDLYYAKKGRGTFKNGKRIKVSEKCDIEKATLSYVTGYSNIKDLRLDKSKDLYRNNTARILDNWCPTLDYCLLAEGKIECVITRDDDLHESIIGQLIIKEAEGLVTDLQGKKMGDNKCNEFLAVNNRKLLRKIVKIIDFKPEGSKTVKCVDLKC
jgi:myo-inositol-1(or 4)-monophosphatase